MPCEQGGLLHMSPAHPALGHVPSFARSSSFAKVAAPGSVRAMLRGLASVDDLGTKPGPATEDEEWSNEKMSPPPTNQADPAGGANPAGDLERSAVGSAKVFGFPKASRLLKRPEFRLVQSKGRKFHAPLFLLLAIPGDHPGLPSRGSLQKMGITVTKKIGDAPERNRFKRLMREAFRQHRTLFPSGAFVVIAKRGATALDLDTIVADVRRLSRRSRGYT